jgi:hypothetical protein
VFVIDSDTGLNCISAWSRSTAWRYTLPTAERNSGGGGVQGGARRRVAAVDSWYSASTMRRDEGHSHTVRNIASGEKKMHTISTNWLAIINAILFLSLHIAVTATPPSPLGTPVSLPPNTVPTLPLLSPSASPSPSHLPRVRSSPWVCTSLPSHMPCPNTPLNRPPVLEFRTEGLQFERDEVVEEESREDNGSIKNRREYRSVHPAVHWPNSRRCARQGIQRNQNYINDRRLTW